MKNEDFKPIDQLLLDQGPIEEHEHNTTLDIIAKQTQISLPTCILRALMNQILEGMKIFHAAGFVHRDIKCDNILLHSPSGSERVYAKISDFGFAKEEDLNNKQTYFLGTIPYSAPEIFKMPLIVTHKVDIYALGITFYRLFTHKYPLNERNFKQQGQKLGQMKSIDQPQDIKDDILWNLLTKMLEFDPNKRITAAEALQHKFFTSPEAISDISQEQIKLANQAAKYQQFQIALNYDLQPSFTVPQSQLLQKVKIVIIF
ncbi:MAG: hypothetical protein EZS28_006791 [Streblomastix strix]|uniref:Protein kinase domain-containing protein n=1 Tax=Streblomastix strix TaxID=222440 RepID=A0A5J4WTI7_9EUKA|nr:MAG: hypothetical protein EZS28_006791 [Streblomastix strix]